MHSLVISCPWLLRYCCLKLRKYKLFYVTGYVSSTLGLDFSKTESFSDINNLSYVRANLPLQE